MAPGDETRSMSDSIRWMFHATAMVRDFDTVAAAMGELFGCRVLHVTTDAERIGRRGGMTWVGDNSLEIGEPAGDDSPVRSFIDRFGPGMHSLAVQVHDVDATADRLEAIGVRVASRPYAGLMFTRPSDTEGLLIEWYSNERDDDPRFGAGLPPAHREPTVLVGQIAYVGAAVADPQRSALRLAEIFGTSVLTMPRPAGPIAPATAVSLGDCALALFDLSATVHQAPLFGRPVDRPQVHTMALKVDDLSVAAASLRAAGIRVVRDGQGVVVPDPSEIGVSVMLTDALLPGDPRLRAMAAERTHGEP